MKKTNRSISGKPRRLSFGKTGESIPFEQIVSLGQKIIEEFDQNQANDLLCRWMAFRIAELIERTQIVKGEDSEAAKRECSDLILALWSKRSRWPNDDPFSGSRRLVKALRPSSFFFGHDRDEEQGTVLSLRKELEQIAVTESQFLLSSALLQLDLENEEEFLADHSEMIPQHQRDVFEAILERADAVKKGFYFSREQPQIHEMSESERSQAIHDYLVELAEERNAVVSDWFTGSNKMSKLEEKSDEVDLQSEVQQ